MPGILLAASDFDPFQIAIVVIFVIAGFIKWLWENWQGKGDAARRDEAEVDPVEQRLRDEAWRRQTGQGQGQRPSPPPIAASSWDELRKAWNELKEAARQPPTIPVPVQPPPLRQTQAQPPPPTRRGSVRATLDAAEAKLAAAREKNASTEAMPRAVVVSSVPIVERAAPSVFLASLYNLRRDPTLLRQAILMQEILGPPKALQSSSDPAI